ncbi:bifunctional 2-C-methyl-D-erythritol 4-phosphate cytidylyltransferase/2-C-methyl-D-erythritol 2,4-cyclodiphosphate synthase [Paraurantiacibacter namhicola]|uniref:Bifunctional enzyme IspD/IspF n=1 Tax=Paraurantiacibacter namhicola TaxID=645517 RepID=A0A1C7D9G7_9SPHN|nr:bifunctional 2-C-methyl-D-erythritol 4-phosphate cytidylyltransferase/2-C-methyl-D-erythritol 2,4-cyclodiphosphate synthase [Paraurantiacibacter namhicola]ANU07953.1 Bifunctional enzyme IspD/IspF [Paraurantiacibacter namhicola]
MPTGQSFAAIVVAAGSGIRAGQAVPKQFAPWRGKPVLRYSVEALLDAGAAPVVVVIPENGDALTLRALEGLTDIHLVTGGATRQASVLAGLEALTDHKPGMVLIHDAARPDLPASVINRLLEALDEESGAIPVLPVVDSMVEASGSVMGAPADRDILRRVQTPQAFRFSDILQAHRAWQGEPDAGDDAQVLRAAGHTIALVDGDERLHKLTFAADFAPEQAKVALPAPRIGMGYDVHRLAAGEELWLCGLRIEHTHGLAGHSDADVGLHAVVDAVLGAAGRGDIGQHFPPSDPQWRGASSDRFVEHAVSLAAQAGYRVGNVDLTLICEAPKIGPHRDAMQAKLADLLGVDTSQVNLKATTTERLGFAGRREGIAAQAVAMLLPI